MTFVDNDVLPLDFAQSRLVVKNVFISSQDYVELLVFEVLSENGSLILFAFISNHTYGWRPSFEFTHPIIDRCQRDHN